MNAVGLAQRVLAGFSRAVRRVDSPPLDGHPRAHDHRCGPVNPERGTVGLSSTVETLNQDGRWVPGRWINGDETQHNNRTGYETDGVSMRSFGIYGYSVFQRN